jgi:hypothetical protein
MIKLLVFAYCDMSVYLFGLHSDWVVFWLNSAWISLLPDRACFICLAKALIVRANREGETLSNDPYMGCRMQGSMHVAFNKLYLMYGGRFFLVFDGFLFPLVHLNKQPTSVLTMFQHKTADVCVTIWTTM